MTNFLKRLRYLVVILCLFIVAAVQADQSVLVLTAEEFDSNLNYLERDVQLIKKPTDPMAPQILIRAPDIGEDVAPPIDVAVAFQASEGATIDLDTLVVKYGWFNITARVRETMDVTANGIAGKIVGMRRGKYSLKVSISDSEQRTSKAKISFTVVELPAGSDG